MPDEVFNAIFSFIKDGLKPEEESPKTSLDKS
jgi:hypothetical protein